MSDLRLPVNSAVTIPVNVLPLVDDTDFKTIETAVAYNAGGIALKWNFVTTAGVMTQTAVTPANAGNYLWTNLGGGMYAVALPASGGGSANNATEGYGWFTGVANGVLPYRGPIVAFEPASAINRKDLGVIQNGTLAAVTSTSQVTLPSSASNNDDAYRGCFFQPTGGTGGDQNGRTIVQQVGRLITLSPPLDQAVGTNTTYDIFSGEQGVADEFQQPVRALSHQGNPLATATQIPTASANAAATWNEIRGGSRPAGSFGAFIDAAISGVTVGGVSADALAAAVWAAIGSANAAPNSHGAQLYTGLNNLINVTTQIITLLGQVSDRTPTLVGGRVPAVAEVVTDKAGYALSATGSATLTEDYPADGQPGNLAQLLYLILSVVSQKSISGTVLTALKLNGTTQAAKYALNDSVAPTSVVRVE